MIEALVVAVDKEHRVGARFQPRDIGTFLGKAWFAQVDEPVCCVKWPWWVNATGDEQIGRELEAYKRGVVVR